MRSCLCRFSSFFLVILFIAVATDTLVAVSLQREIPYYVDAAGPEYDLEQEANLHNTVRQLPREQQFKANIGNNVRLLRRWRVFLRSDGTWAPDPTSGVQDYGDQHYPVEYLLPLGYRGTFLVAWNVPGAPPLQMVNNKIEIYIPASGVYQTSSALALTNGSVASIEQNFYFEQDGKRTVIPHGLLQPGQIGINPGTTGCRKMPGRCYTYFVGSMEEWRAAMAAQCPTSEAELQATASGHKCSDVPPGSTQPVSDIVPPPGKPAIIASEFHGRTLNGRRVVLSTAPSGVTSWRFDGPEPRVPEEPALAAELKTYIESILAADLSTTLEPAECSPEQMKALLRASRAGPYRFFRPPYGSKIGAQFVVTEKSERGTIYNALLFARGEQGWKLVSSDYGSNNWRFYELASSLKTEISEFVGKAQLGESTVVLRKDGAWDSDDLGGFQLREHSDQSFPGHDMNGNELDLAIDDHGRGTWRRLHDKAQQMYTETVISDLNRALDRYIELLSAGNIEGFLAEGGEQNDAYMFYSGLEKFGDDSKEANDIYDFLKQNSDTQGLVQEYGEGHFKQAMKKSLLKAAIQQVDLPSTLQELKRLRGATPRIAPPAPFSPDFEAIYTLPPNKSGQSHTVRRMIGHGSTWAIQRE